MATRSLRRNRSRKVKKSKKLKRLVGGEIEKCPECGQLTYECTVAEGRPYCFCNNRKCEFSSVPWT